MYRAEKFSHDDLGDFYQSVNRELRHLIEYEDEWLPALGNAAALLSHQLRDINWAGFYLVKNGLLLLGPFQGRPACGSIAIGSGVCGAAANRRETVVVPDVHLFPGHIACDSASQSEIVIPLLKEGILYGVLDIDSPLKDRFTEADRRGLETFVGVLMEYLPWCKIHF